MTSSDLAVREVAVLEDGHRERGTHDVGFDASGLASGVYLCTLRAGGIMDTRKLLLVK